MSYLSPSAKALLNTIAGPESAGRYDVIYGGGRFSDFSHHPNQAVRIQTGPNANRTSSAAGRYQFLNSTWNDQAKKLGLKDFSPDSQDAAAWNLASETYKAKTGQDLTAVLQSNDPNAIANVGEALNGTWTSLPGGIEQGTNRNRFFDTYQKNMYAGMADGPKGQESYPILGPETTASTNAPGGGILGGVPQDVGPAVAKALNPDEQSPLQKMLKALSAIPDAPAPRFGQMGDARNTGDSLLKALSAPKFADTLLQKRLG